MAQKVQFLGFKRVLTGAQMDDNYLYFVRDAGELEGKLWFNGVCYGSCRDTEIDDINTALAGFLSGGTVTDVKEYIDSLIGGKDASVTGTSADNHVTVQVDETDGALTSVVVTTSDIASATALTAEETARENADTALQTEIDAIETAVGLSSGGTYVAGDGQFTSAATSVADAIDKLDAAIVANVDDLEQKIENAIDELDADESGSSTYVNVRVQEEDGVITSVSVDDSALEAAIQAMDLAEVHEAGKAIVAVSEEDGIVSATAGTIAAQYVDIADAGELFTATNVEDALAEIDAAYKAADAAIVGDATESGNTLGKLEDRIEELSADAKEYHLVKNEDNLPAEVKEQYYLVDADGNQSGATINIYKDSHIKSITYITDSADTHFQNLKYEYIDVCGDTKTEYVDMSALILEQEFASGITVNNAGIVHGVVDPASENFLTVGAGGFKLSGVQDAIDAAVSAETEAREDADDAIESALTLTAQTLVEMIENAASAATTEVVEGTDAGNNLSIAETAGADGHKIYTINLTDVASASALTQEISDREAADAVIQAELDAVESSLGFDGTAYTQSDKSYISGRTVSEDIHLLDAALDANNDAILALQEALDNEVTARTEAVNEEASARTAADNALDERLDAIEEAYITGVTVNDCAATVTDHVASVEIHADDIEIGTPLTADTGSSISGFDADDKVDEVLQAIVDKLNEATAGSYTGVTTSDGSIIATSQTNGQDLSVRVKELELADVQAGETEVKKDESTGALYGVMYWIDEETA